jgi:hypothetical protein
MKIKMNIRQKLDLQIYDVLAQEDIGSMLDPPFKYFFPRQKGFLSKTNINIKSNWKCSILVQQFHNRGVP